MKQKWLISGSNSFGIFRQNAEVSVAVVVVVVAIVVVVVVTETRIEKVSTTLVQ